MFGAMGFRASRVSQLALGVLKAFGIFRGLVELWGLGSH